MPINSSLFKSETCEWETPIEFFEKYDGIFHFDLDVCATEQNKKCKAYFSKEQNGLIQKWHGKCWMNPPYGKEISKWMKKAFESVMNEDAELVCCLVPARTDTAWWHDYAMMGEITFIRGRLKFGGSKNGAPFPSAVVVFRNFKLEEAQA